MQRLTCATLVVWVTGVLPAFSQTRQIVLLYDERTDLPGLAMLDAGFVRALTSGSPNRVEIYREAMDLSRFDSDAYRKLLRDHLRAKYAAKKIDVAVAVMEPALDFLLSHRDDVFPGAPIVFCGIDRGRLGGRPLPSDATGVLMKREFSPTLEIALGLHPETDQIVVVAGTSEFDARLLEHAREEFRPFVDRLAFTYLTALPLPELLSQLSRLPPKTIVLYSTVFRDGAGNPFVPHEVAERVSAAANAPVYGFHDQFLGRGIVGGRLYGMGPNGEAAAGLVLKILAGTKASEIALIEPASRVTAFDWRQLQRWSISENRLPPGSTVLFRELTIWGQYGKAITGAILFCLLQAALIVSLLINRARRRREEAEATLIADISSKFVNLPPGEVDREIGDVQRRIFEVLDLDVSGFWQWSADASGFFRLTHYSRAGEGPQIPELMNSQEYFPWYQQQILAGRTMAVRSMTELPPEAARDRETFRQFGFKSNLTIPLSVGGEPPVGALGFNTSGAERDWPDALVKRLQLVAQIFANALARQRADQALRESEERYREVVESQTDLVCRYRADTTLTFVNEAYCRFFGKRREDLIGSKFLELIPRAAWNVVLADIASLIKEHRVLTHEHEVMFSDGSIGWQQWVNHPIVQPDGTVAEYQAIGRDITDRKRAEEASRQLAHATRVSTMGALAGSLAHELNQPLTAILSNAQAGSRFLAGPSANVAEVREVLQDIAQDTQRAGDVIRQLRKLVKKGDIQFEAQDLNLLIHDTVRLLHGDAVIRKVQIMLDLHGDLPSVRGDGVQLQQVMFNLLLNAFDAMKDIPEGERTVCVRTRQPDSSAIQIEVSDRGTGINPDRLPRLFEPFQTTKQEGLGLGLSISRSIVEAHGGRLWATNNADRGATFWFTLPLLSAAPNSALLQPRQS